MYIVYIQNVYTPLCCIPEQPNFLKTVAALSSSVMLGAIAHTAHALLWSYTCLTQK